MKVSQWLFSGADFKLLLHLDVIGYLVTSTSLTWILFYQTAKSLSLSNSTANGWVIVFGLWSIYFAPQFYFYPIHRGKWYGWLWYLQQYLELYFKVQAFACIMFDNRFFADEYNSVEKFQKNSIWKKVAVYSLQNAK